MPARRPARKRTADPLKTYRSKRDFGKTPEPDQPSTAGEGRSFVIQEHHARSHHFDFRLEMDGVLVSWAVPKGIPEEPDLKRLAVHVEDHPLDYGSFEGTIPKGNYGAGTVAIWDKGTWEPIEKNWRKAFEKGKLKFTLHGGKLHGPYFLVRMNEEPNWLLRKIDDEHVHASDIKTEQEKPGFVSPQLARLAPAVPSGDKWLHEIKYDGYRLIAVKQGEQVRLFTRNEIDWTDRFAGLAESLAELSDKNFVVDGEAVVFDKKGRTNFGELQSALSGAKGDKIEFVVFDILHYDGENLRGLPLSMRLKKLTALVSEDSSPIRLSRVWPANHGKELFRQACQNGLEGIVCKNADGRYLAGTRRDWFKCKCRARQEFCICGFTEPKGGRTDFGAIILASYENGKWIHRGRVGTGFSEASRRELLKKFKRIISPKPLFADESTEDVTWLKPELVAEIEYAEITAAGLIRQGSFIALREDKKSADVHLDLQPPAVAEAKDLEVCGIHITHPERVVYPADGVSKFEVASYYQKVVDFMLPYVSGRPLAVVRAPDGLGGGLFFQKSFSTHVPPEVSQKKLDDGTDIFTITNATGLLSLVQFGVIEFHPWGSSLPDVDKPDMLVWDLDPDKEVAWKEVLGTAVLLRDTLKSHGLESVVKTSGGKGLHIIVFVKRKHDWEIMRQYAKSVACEVAACNPKRLITTSTKAKRRGKIYIDWLRNGRGATCIAPWCLRARDGATVSMPFDWKDISEITPDGFSIRHVREVPSEWVNPKHQTVTMSVLRNLGILG